jgi:hypothetical protein
MNVAYVDSCRFPSPSRLLMSISVPPCRAAVYETSINVCVLSIRVAVRQFFVESCRLNRGNIKPSEKRRQYAPLSLGQAGAWLTKLSEFCQPSAD